MYAKYVALRDAKGLKDADVSRATGISPDTFSAWKQGKYSPKIEKLIKLADFFGITLDELARA